ncbi:MAG: phosphosulfolactate synthase [Nitrospirota bacterium]
MDTPTQPSNGLGSQTWEYLSYIGVAALPPRTSPFDPGYDPLTVEHHLAQSAHLMSALKLSMACWQVANEEATRRKISAAQRCRVPVCTGGGPYEIASALGALPQYLDLCAKLGVTRVEAGAGFTEQQLEPAEVVRMARSRGLEVQFEIGDKHAGAFTDETVQQLVDQGRRWLDAGAVKIVVEARESANDVGLFNARGEFNGRFAERLARAYGMEATVFEAPNKASQFALLTHFGPDVQLGNVRLEELLRVEIYRRGLHSDAFRHQHLRPRGPAARKANG